MRYAMRLDPIWRPLLAVVGGATAGNSYIEVEGDDVRLRFGLLFSEHVPRTEIVSASKTGWPLLGGIGWRIWPLRCVGLIGSRQGVVELRLREPRRMHLGPAPLWRFERVCVSVEDPDAVVAALATAAA